jgi:hypothetical protein
MNELVLLESRTARQDRLTDVNDDRALETINKAKALLMAMWQGTGIATTEQMAEYYEVHNDTVKKVYQRNREELDLDGVKTLKGQVLKDYFKSISETRMVDGGDMMSPTGTRINSSLLIWTPRAALRLGMLLRDSLVAQQVRTILLDVAEQQPKAIGLLANTIEAHNDRLTAIEQHLTTPQHKALPKASVDPIPGEMTPMTERQCITRLIRSYVRRWNTTQIGKRKTEQEITQWMYRELKYRHKFDAYARIKNSKYKTKIDLIEAEGYLPQLHAICNHFLGH